MARWHRDPDVDRPEGRLQRHADVPEPVDDDVPSRLVHGPHPLDVILGPGERGHRGALHGGEDPGVEVRLEGGQRAHGRPAAHGVPDTPAGHVVGLGERAELDHALLPARSGERAGSHVAVEGDLAVRRVMRDQQVVLLGEGDGPGEEGAVGDRRGGIAGVVEPYDLRRVRRRQRVEIGEEPSGLVEPEQPRRRSGERRRRRVHRIPRVGDERFVSRVEGGEGEVRQPLLRPDEGEHLRLGVELDAEPPPVERRDRLSEVAEAVVGGIPVGRGIRRRLPQCLDDVRGRGKVRVPYPERDDIGSCRSPLGDLPIELGEQVRRERLDPAGQPHRRTPAAAAPWAAAAIQPGSSSPSKTRTAGPVMRT